MRSILMLMAILIAILTACQPVSPEQANADFAQTLLPIRLHWRDRANC